MGDLLLPEAERKCDVGVAGISATSERIAEGGWFCCGNSESPAWPMKHAGWKREVRPHDQCLERWWMADAPLGHLLCAAGVQWLD